MGTFTLKYLDGSGERCYYRCQADSYEAAVEVMQVIEEGEAIKIELFKYVGDE